MGASVFSQLYCITKSKNSSFKGRKSLLLQILNFEGSQVEEGIRSWSPLNYNEKNLLHSKKVFHLRSNWHGFQFTSSFLDLAQNGVKRVFVSRICFFSTNGESDVLDRRQRWDLTHLCIHSLYRYSVKSIYWVPLGWWRSLSDAPSICRDNTS